MLEESGVNISQAAKENGLALNAAGGAALSLANRSHGTFAASQFDDKMKVKSYRYTFQFLYDEFKGSPQQFVLKTNPKLYEGPFSDYAIDSFRILKVDPVPYTPEQMEEYYTN